MVMSNLHTRHMCPYTQMLKPINTPIHHLTLRLPLSDKTCIINRAKCCQETSLIPINAHSLICGHINNTYMASKASGIIPSSYSHLVDTSPTHTHTHCDKNKDS